MRGGPEGGGGPDSMPVPISSHFLFISLEVVAVAAVGVGGGGGPLERMFLQSPLMIRVASHKQTACALVVGPSFSSGFPEATLSRQSMSAHGAIHLEPKA